MIFFFYICSSVVNGGTDVNTNVDVGESLVNSDFHAFRASAGDHMNIDLDQQCSHSQVYRQSIVLCSKMSQQIIFRLRSLLWVGVKTGRIWNR